MSISPQVRVLQSRLARELSGRDLYGLAAIEEVVSVATMAAHYAEEHSYDPELGPRMAVVEDGLNVIRRRAKRAVDVVARLIDAAQSLVDEIGRDGPSNEVDDVVANTEDDESNCIDDDKPIVASPNKAEARRPKSRSPASKTPRR